MLSDLYSLGRGLEYSDVETSDQIVARIEAANGRISALIAGVVESAAFQKTRLAEESETGSKSKVRSQTDAGTKL